MAIHKRIGSASESTVLLLPNRQPWSGEQLWVSIWPWRIYNNSKIDVFGSDTSGCGGTQYVTIWNSWMFLKQTLSATSAQSKKLCTVALQECDDSTVKAMTTWCVMLRRIVAQVPRINLSVLAWIQDWNAPCPLDRTLAYASTIQLNAALSSSIPWACHTSMHEQGFCLRCK